MMRRSHLRNQTFFSRKVTKSKNKSQLKSRACLSLTRKVAMSKNTNYLKARELLDLLQTIHCKIPKMNQKIPPCSLENSFKDNR